VTPRRRIGLLACLVLCLPVGGCAGFWDEVFSRERDLNAYFNPPDPLVVLEKSTDGELRARALASLREPGPDGRPQEQEKYLLILTTAAKTDRDPLCRLGAIQALGHFKDPRAAVALREVFEQTVKLPFTQDFNSLIRLTALRSIEKLGSDDSRQLLILVARQPRPAHDASSVDRQQTQDEKLIAIRALGKYRQPECAETLVYILESEKDVALRDRAHQSLQDSTGKTLPPEAQVWRLALAGQPTGVEPPNLIQRVSGWFTKQ
jgi:HEAT repeat protein